MRFIHSFSSNLVSFNSILSSLISYRCRVSWLRSREWSMNEWTNESSAVRMLIDVERIFRSVNQSWSTLSTHAIKKDYSSLSFSLFSTNYFIRLLIQFTHTAWAELSLSPSKPYLSVLFSFPSKITKNTPQQPLNHQTLLAPCQLYLAFQPCSEYSVWKELDPKQLPLIYT